MLYIKGRDVLFLIIKFCKFYTLKVQLSAEITKQIAISFIVYQIVRAFLRDDYLILNIVMETMEIYYWLAVIQEAKSGNKEAQEMLEAENALRTEKGRLTVEQELMKIAETGN